MRISIRSRHFTTPTDKTVDILYRIVGDITLTIQIAKSETLEIVRTLRYERVHLDGGESDREPDQTGSDQGPRRKQVQWDGNDDFGVPVAAGKYFVAFTERRPIIPNPSTDPVTEYSYHYSYLEFELESTYIHITANATADANFIDVFATLEGRVGYYWIARMPAGETIVYKFPLFDNFTPQVTEFETPEVEYIARNDLRTYTAEVGSDTVYISHFDAGTGERLLYNYTHIIPLELGDGFITGLVFTRERNLVVYCSNQIQIITTGALIEQHGVLDFIQPSDEKGERVGTAAPGSIVDMGGHHFFLASNRYVYMFDAQRAIKVSDAIHGIFQQIELSRTSDGNVELENGVVAFAHDNHYAISVGDKTLVYDTVHGVWWQDTFSVSKAIRDDTGRVYGEIDGNAYILYEGDDDDGQPIQRRFKSNPYNQHSHSQWDSVHVYALGSAIIEVVCSTEQSTARGMLEIPDAGDWWSQRLGVNLQGRYYEVEIITESDVAIDRIMVNERMRKRRGR